jgi:hypothetical protein
MRPIFYSFLVLLLASCISKPAADSAPINEYQFIGSHNSYKEYIDKDLFDIMISRDTSRTAETLEYHHIALSDQLNLGLRSLELDVFIDEAGGKYSEPLGLQMAALQTARPYDPDKKMTTPGFKVLHIQEVDFRSTCLLLTDCLAELKYWSDTHPDHEPVFITINAKDEGIFVENSTVPDQFSSAHFDQLDQVIMDGLGMEKLITPNAIRGDQPTLIDAIRKVGWPTLDQSRGKFVFILDENATKIAAYTKDHPGLKDRLMFVNAIPGSPESAILIINDPIRDQDKIRQLVKEGYIVRTRADADTQEARKNDYNRFAAAKSSGAQIISTDYYLKSTLFPSEYSVKFDDRTYFRKNPLFGQ